MDEDECFNPSEDHPGIRFFEPSLGNGAVLHALAQVHVAQAETEEDQTETEQIEDEPKRGDTADYAGERFSDSVRSNVLLNAQAQPQEAQAETEQAEDDQNHCNNTDSQTAVDGDVPRGLDSSTHVVIGQREYEQYDDDTPVPPPAWSGWLAGDWGLE